MSLNRAVFAMYSGGSLLFLFANAVGTLSSPFAIREAVTPAATTVSTDSPAGALLFPWESVQLTEDVLKETNSQMNDVDVATLFGFDNSIETTIKTRRQISSGECKALSGDESYPKLSVWSAFDSLLGGVLIKTTPVAAPCYKNSAWDDYDESKCEDISARFMTADLQ